MRWRVGFLASVALVGVAVACSGTFSASGVDGENDATAPTNVPTTLAPEGGRDDASPTPETDSGPDAAPTLTFTDDFERPDGAMVPPWDGVNVNRGRLVIERPMGASSYVLVAQTEPTSGAAAYPERRFSANVMRGEATFKLKIVDFAQADGGTNETANIFSLRLETATPDGGTGGPDHVLRVGLRKRSSTRFAVFVMSQFDGTQTRTNDSTTTLELGREYTFRFFIDASTPRPGVPVVRALVDGAEVAVLDGTGERVHPHLPRGTFYFPGAVSGGSGFHLELDDLNFVGRP